MLENHTQKTKNENKIRKCAKNRIKETNVPGFFQCARLC